MTIYYDPHSKHCFETNMFGHFRAVYKPKGGKMPKGAVELAHVDTVPGHSGESYIAMRQDKPVLSLGAMGVFRVLESIIENYPNASGRVLVGRLHAFFKRGSADKDVLNTALRLAYRLHLPGEYTHFANQALTSDPYGWLNVMVQVHEAKNGPRKAS